MSGTSMRSSLWSWAALLILLGAVFSSTGCQLLKDKARDAGGAAAAGAAEAARAWWEDEREEVLAEAKAWAETKKAEAIEAAEKKGAEIQAHIEEKAEEGALWAKGLAAILAALGVGKKLYDSGRGTPGAGTTT